MKSDLNKTPDPKKRIFMNQVLPPINPDRIFTPEELAEYNGRNGKAAYVAVNGVVYDVTNNPRWAEAAHYGLRAGKDLTNEFEACHPGAMVLSVLPVVGRLSNKK